VTEPYLEVRRADLDDEAWIRALMKERRHGETVAAHGRLYEPATLPAFVAVEGLIEPVGVLTYMLEGGACEIVTLDSIREGIGVGSLLIGAVLALARDVGCERLWLVTTNDDERALGWCRRHGFRQVAVHPGAVARSRELKPSIPLHSDAGVPIVDEIELEIQLV
jgi:N-acetylglutamate synthase-like GNAT family acetyltransferase